MSGAASVVAEFLWKLVTFVLKNGDVAAEMAKVVIDACKGGVVDKEAIREGLKRFDPHGAQTTELMAILDDPSIAEAVAKAESALE
jgi:hypothetical protein